jgi:hypothetical protein
MKKRDNFNKIIVDALAKRASYICSQPECKVLTICPSDIISDKWLYIGKAAHITAAASGGLRYDESLTPQQRGAIENAIFLCSSCADMIDKNNGADFSTEVLREWKLQHESWVRRNLNKSIFSLISKEANQRPVIDISRRGISVVEIEKDKLSFNIPYCSGKNANAHNVKLDVMVALKDEDEFLLLKEYSDTFPDNISLSYETGKSLNFWLYPLAIDGLPRIYICVKGSYKDATETLTFPVFDVFNYHDLSKSWIRLPGQEDRDMREVFNNFSEFKNSDGEISD